MTVVNPLNAQAFSLGDSVLMTRNPPGPSALSLLLNYTDTAANFPPFIQVSTMWGLETRIATENRSVTFADMPLSISAPPGYLGNGYDSASLRVTGPLDSFTLTRTIGSFVPLSQVQLQAGSGPALAAGFGPDANEFPAGTPVTVYLTAPGLSKPSFGNAVFNLNQQSPAVLITSVVTNTSSAQVVLPAEGSYNMNVVIRNPFETITSTMVLKATAPIRGLQISLVGKTVNVNEPQSIALAFLAISDDSCLSAFESLCRQMTNCTRDAQLTSGWVTAVPNVGLQLLVPAIYTRPGNFLVHVRAHVGTSTVSGSLSITVLDPSAPTTSCLPPDLGFIPSHMTSAATPHTGQSSSETAVRVFGGVRPSLPAK
ncbi:hypothetical protein Ciccas_011006, partial [Cichlidogyrus casuarinus]